MLKDKKMRQESKHKKMNSANATFEQNTLTMASGHRH